MLRLDDVERPVPKDDEVLVKVHATTVTRTDCHMTVVFFIVKLTREDLVVLSELLEAGKLTSVIDRRYELDEIADAMGYLGEGHARGKIVVTV